MGSNTNGSLQIEHVPIDRLRPDPANPRRISDAELEALTRSIREFGLIDPIIARHDDQIVIGGHQRLQAARKLGLETVPVVYVDLSPEQSRVLNLALNKISGSWDDELLARMVADLSALEEIDLSLSGFGDDELGKLLKSLDRREKRERAESFDLDAALEAAQGAPGAARGDLWALGEHRLLCGDATDAGDVARLIEGRKAQMAFTDPPYNVAYQGGSPGQGRRKRIKNDALPAEEWATFCQAWGKNLLDAVDGAVYVCMAVNERLPILFNALRESGGRWANMIVWAKDRFLLGGGDYHWQYEPIWYGWPEKTKRTWNGGRDQGNVWKIARPSVSEAHPTMKPLELVERAVENSSNDGDVVLDVFLGSGSTLVACERTGRVCYGLEIDLTYVRTAVARWEAFTGEKAKRVRR